MVQINILGYLINLLQPCLSAVLEYEIIRETPTDYCQMYVFIVRIEVDLGALQLLFRSHKEGYYCK